MYNEYYSLIFWLKISLDELKCHQNHFFDFDGMSTRLGIFLDILEAEIKATV